MAGKSLSKYALPDIVTIFFQDVGECSVVGGKNEYLPLTRRIERGRLMVDVMGQDDYETLRNIQEQLFTSFEQLKSIILGNAFDDETFFYTISEDVEAFLDNPDWDIPPALNASNDQISLSEDGQLREICWRSFYLFSLLPATARKNYLTETITNEIRSHFQVVLDEYEQSKQNLIEGTLRYSIRLARHYLHSGVPYLDLVQEGVLGVIHAIDGFQESAGAHFQSYAANWIQQRIRRYIADHSRLIRIPVHRHDTASLIEQKQQELLDEFGSKPSDYQLFVALEWLSEADVMVLEQHREHIRRKSILKRVKEYRHLLEYRDRSLSEIPERVRMMVLDLDMAHQNLTARFGEPPDDFVLFQEVGWLSKEDIRCLQKDDGHSAKPEKLKQAQSKLRKAQMEMRYFRMANAIHFSLEMPIPVRDSSFCTSIESFLTAECNVENEVDKLLLKDAVQELLNQLSEREREVLSLRFGLSDDQERTLEEVGQIFGVTRERVRQIEAKAIGKMKRPGKNDIVADFVEDIPFASASADEALRRMLLQALHRQEMIDDTERDQRIFNQKALIETMIDRHVMQGQKRTRTRSPFGSRAQMFKQILEAAGEPLHYTVIHERTLQNLPPEYHYPKERTYATLFYSDTFHLLGNGMFGLASWDTVTSNLAGEVVLNHCPQPLLPADADKRAFFESVMVGRELLKRDPGLTATQFYAEMQVWAGQANHQAMQPAFDAWYAVGLLGGLDVSYGSKNTLQLTIDPNAKLNDVRLHCLNALCHRILKMPELLLTLTRIARPVVSDIQKVLFGSERAGFDVPIRLNMLLAFEAVQHVNGEWRLTPVGETILAANPPQELPDFSVIDEAVTDESDALLNELDWEDELGLLDV